MKLCTGVDLIEVERIQQAVERHGDRFLKRVYTAMEQADCGCNYQSLAARFAAKEAVSKAFGTGIGAVAFKELEITRVESGAPEIRLHGRAKELAEQLGLNTWSISLSHSEDYALAFVVALGD